MKPLRRRARSLLPFAGLSLCAHALPAEDNPHGDVFKNRPVPAVVDFNRDVKPFFSEKCFHCHGPDEKARKAKLRLDQRDDAVRQRNDSPAISPKNPEASEVMKRIVSTDPEEVMPPPKDGKPLSAREIEIMKKWIAQGAPYAEHWAFVKPVKAAIPDFSNLNSPISNPIDAFVTAALGENGLGLSPEADRHTLVRRVALDLTGLPPTPDEVTAFVNDDSAGAYGRMVDRFLAQPAYGERWARVWLDVARYADSAGYGSDPLRPNIWPYRDWVIHAFNQNLPYDQFTLEQLAGDLLPGATQQQLVASAFHRNTMTNTEGGTDDEEFRVAAIKDRVALTVQAWMGLTMGCAQCHSHKFDPISQEEYYQFYAIFNQTEDSDKADEAPTLPMPSVADGKRKLALSEELEHLRKLKALRDQAAELEELLQVPVDAEARKKTTGELDARLKKAQKALADFKPLAVPVMRELASDKQRETHLLNKGSFLDPGAKVEPALLKGFHRAPDGKPNRTTVAQWLTSRDNPLTARVAVNRLWAQLFGTGLVETEEDFGTQGALPSHPELLDWLAVEFMDLNWDQKALLKEIVMSATYRQSSKATGKAVKLDSRNRLLSHYPRRRLDAEQVRDQALALSGLLSPKLGGPSVYPPQPDGLWRAAFNGQRSWETSKGEDRYRRGLYTFWRRTVPYPSMATFDAPSRENATMRRVPTNTPLQAFVTLNDPAFFEMAQALAARMLREGGGTIESRVKFGLELCLARPASKAQIATLAQLCRAETGNFKSMPDDAKKLSASATLPADKKFPTELDAAEAAAWIEVANVLLNLDGVLTKG